MSLTKERIDGFLKELFDLSMKYRIEIWGCGCDGSPSMKDISEDIHPVEYKVCMFEYDYNQTGNDKLYADDLEMVFKATD